ncbi:DUF2294 domain-containing protein [Salipaludibacillus sp. CF4.18]|uniref:DUF2294 domain-containing protein n=1 Tax=Salipaludibacillus sp. CF4.18 TaxID=3373081 RepID=UPI003EE6F823
MIQFDTSQNKKVLAHIYNDVSKELFGVGTTLLKISIDQNIITFQAKHRRSSRSAALEGEDPSLKREIDFRMSLLYKRKLNERIKQELNFPIEVVLRDYDASTQIAFTNIVLLDEN